MWILTNCSSVLCVLMFFGMSNLDVVVIFFGFVMISGCVVYASCLISSCLLVMQLMLTCNIDMPVARGVMIGLCGIFGC